MTDLRHDPMSGRWVAIAPTRSKRPGAAAPVGDELETCPFCADREDRTPPETLVLGDGSTGWDVRVVPNLFPALERQEVVVHGPEHRRSLADVGDDTLDLVAEAWQRRARDAGGTMFAFVNEGQDAGASLPHSHSQLVWLPDTPPALAGERGLPQTIPLLEQEGVAAGCPIASRVPYELLIAPVDREADALASDRLPAALHLLAELARRLRAVHERDVPFNAWLHDGPHWHLEVVPRTTRFAGLELGAGVYINAVAPEDAAAALRNVARPV